MITPTRAATVLLIVALTAAACGGDDNNTTASPTVASTSAPASPQTEPTADPAGEALAAGLQYLAPLVLQPPDVPAEFTLRNNQAIGPRDAAVANIGIQPLARYIDGSDLEGAWAAFFTQEDRALSSIVYAFATPAGATGLVGTFAALEPADYPAADTVERVQAGAIEDASQMMLYVLTGARTLEYTWAQGRYAGQIVLRYAGETGNPDDVAFVVSLARTQTERMRAAP